jgi:hypothetical protein
MVFEGIVLGIAHNVSAVYDVLPALVLLRKPLFGLAKRHIQPGRYVPFF